MFAIINAAAQAYRGVITADRWHEPYMPKDELLSEIRAGVVFWVADDEGQLAGVMGIQDKGEVALVRHAYIAPTVQRKGVGTKLLRHVQGLTDKPMLIGTWPAAAGGIEGRATAAGDTRAQMRDRPWRHSLVAPGWAGVKAAKIPGYIRGGWWRSEGARPGPSVGLRRGLKPGSASATKRVATPPAKP